MPTQDMTAGSPKKGNDNRKQSLYFPDDVLNEIRSEAARLDRSLSWVVQRAWKIARARIKELGNEPRDPEDPA